MASRSFSVRYIKSFVEKTKDLLSEDDLKKLSAILCDDPFGNSAHESIENLYYIEWTLSDRKSNAPEIYIWYVADKEVDHIEVIAFTTQKDDDDRGPSGPDNTTYVKRWVRFLVRLMYYAAYGLWKWWNE